MADGLEWYPADLVDESCPPSKASPEAFAFFDGERWQLGYAPADPDVTDEEDRETYNRAIAPGEVVLFMTCDRLGDVEATLRRDGSFDIRGEIPRSHNVVSVDGDSDLLYQSFDELIEAIKCPDAFSDPGQYLFDKDADSADVVLSFADWSDSLPHLFEVVDGKPTFRPVPAQKN